MKKDCETQIMELRETMDCPKCNGNMWVSLIDGTKDGSDFYITWECHCGEIVDEYYERKETNRV